MRFHKDSLEIIAMIAISFCVIFISILVYKHCENTRRDFLSRDYILKPNGEWSSNIEVKK